MAIIGVFLFIGFEPITMGSNFKEDRLDQNQDVGNDWGIIQLDNKCAQSFKPTLNTLTRIKSVVAKNGNPVGNLKVSIRKNLIGNDLTSKSIPANDLQAYPNEFWIEFDFPDISVNPDETYYIVWSGDPSWEWSEEGGDYVSIRLYVGDIYDRGKGWVYDFEKKEWLPAKEQHGYPLEFCFKTYGCSFQSPVADFEWNPKKPFTGEEINFCASGSYDPDGIIVNCEWDFNNDGTIDADECCDVKFSWSSPGEYAVKLTVTDDDGLKDSKVDYVTVINDEKPTVSIESPNSGDVVNGTVIIQGIASDFEENLEMVQIKIDDDEWIDINGLNEWWYYWDTVDETEETHTIKARSYDGSKYSEIESIDVIVDNLPEMLKIKEISGGFCKLTFEVYNQGENYINRLYWSVSVESSLLGREIYSDSGYFYTLEAGETDKVTIKDLIIGIGLIRIKVIANADECEEISKTVNGFILGPFIIL